MKGFIVAVAILTAVVSVCLSAFGCVLLAISAPDIITGRDLLGLVHLATIAIAIICGNAALDVLLERGHHREKE